MAAALVLALLLSGCYGSTEPATSVGFDHATFNGQGTTNSGPARVYFEYWANADPSRVTRTTGKDVPAGRTGPFSEPHLAIPYGLDPNTQYSFRICATDSSAPSGACAQTRTFRTARPAGDLVRGFYAEEIGGVGHSGSVDATSGSTGANPSGTLSLPGALGNTFSGNVTCVLVQGREAVVGATGTTFDGKPASGLLKVRAGASMYEQDGFAYKVAPGAAAPSCAGASFGELRDQALVLLTVFDTP